MSTQPSRRRFLAYALPAAAVLSVPHRIFAQGMPETARILNGYVPGGSLDTISRKLAERMTGRWARNVIVENKPGAAGRLAVEALRNSAADGTHMLVTPGSVVTMYPHIYKQLSYDVFRDLAPVSIVAVSGFALAVGPAVPVTVRTFDDFVAWCKANPGGANCGNPGAGSFPHFMAMLLARDAKVALTHVPFQGGLTAMRAVAGGQVAAALSTEASAVGLEQAGRIRVLATSGNERSAFLAQAPTFREIGYPNLSQREWFAAFMPARTPASSTSAAAEAIRTVMREPEVRDVWHRAALSAEVSTPTELLQAMHAEYDFWGPIIRASNFSPES